MYIKKKNPIKSSIKISGYIWKLRQFNDHLKYWNSITVLIAYYIHAQNSCSLVNMPDPKDCLIHVPLNRKLLLTTTA